MQKIGIVMLLAVALFAVPALAQNAVSGTGNVDILAQGIFEAEGSVVQVPPSDNANIDGVIVGNNRALAFGTPWGFNNPNPVAQNNLEIKKNQQGPSPIIDTTVTTGGVTETTPLINAEQIKVGNMDALAFGSGSATNNIKIVTNQMVGAPFEYAETATP